MHETTHLERAPGADLRSCHRAFTAAAADSTPERFAGVDLSYVNEVEACGAEFRLGGKLRDPYELFAEKGRQPGAAAALERSLLD
jgi:hypothetical protein